MGAWGRGPFENDDAADFLGDLEENPRWGPVVRALTRSRPRGYLEAPDASVGLCAAALIAAKRDSSAVPGADEQSVLTELRSPPFYAGFLAKLAIERIATRSELQELWEESDEYAEWRSECFVMHRALG